MTDTTAAQPTRPFPFDTQSQTKLTKKQKKALAFRDKSHKSKPRNFNQRDEPEVEMEDLHVVDVEKPDVPRHASSPVQMATMEDQGRKSSSRGNKATSPSSKRASGNTLSREQTQETRARQKPQQKHQRVSEDGNKQYSGDAAREIKKLTKKRKAERLDGVDDLVEGLEREAESAEEKARHKKRKTEKAESRLDRREEEESEGEEMSDEEGETGKGKGERKEQRFILFLGNLKYTTSVETIQTHFDACVPPPEIRLLTPRASATGKTSTKSKGCAFLEFKNKIALQQALKQHQSMLDGRMINVELTAGGGGKGEKRMNKLRERNRELFGQRKKKVDKKGKKEGSLPTKPDNPQRYSATSGLEQTIPKGKRTWTTGNATEDEVHRGGQKHKRTPGSRKSRMKDWASGVNAIPVG